MGFFKKKTNEQIERETKIYAEKEKKRQAFLKARNDRAEKIKKLRDLKSKNTKSGRFFSGVGRVANSLYSDISEKNKTNQKVVYVKKKKPKRKSSQKIVYVEKKQEKPKNDYSIEAFEKKLKKIL